MRPVEEIARALESGDAVLARVDRTEGSVPRESSTWMAVFAQGVIGTIGGGHLELQVLAEARRRLAATDRVAAATVVRYPLGPALGQCCGGVMHVRYEHVTARDAAGLPARLQGYFTPVALFGGGHVGKALVNVLGTLPFQVTWVDSRDEIFPLRVPENVTCEHSDPVQAAVAGLPRGTRVLVMSFSHAEDLEIVAACLRRVRDRADLPYVGLIGSKTRWAIFGRRLEERGFPQEELLNITCPIGVPGVDGKEPEVIAVAVAAQLLQLPGTG